ncbi:MAG: DnaJ domain-containing protein [Phycisphaerales bacterium]|nr:DnaJ domain-containing protein [Phycisphaerales bacterium]
MAGRDYYQVLGLSRSATPDEIRKAYRKLAREKHPDVNKATDAQKQFTEIQHAYDILSDEQKRKMYDQYGEAYISGARGEAASAGRGGPHVRWSNVGGQPGAGAPDFDMDDLSSMFEAMFGGRAAGGAAGGASGGGPGAARGRGGKPRRAAEPEPETEPVRHDLHISFMTAVKGGTETLQLQSEGAKRTVEVNIPAGIHDGATLRIRNAFSKQGGPELLLTVRVGGHSVFQRGEGLQLGKGNDLFVDLPLNMAEATLGAVVTVPTPDGNVEVTVPPGTASGKRLRLKGKGIRSAGGEAGDLYAVIKIIPPKADDLTADEKEVLRGISSRGTSPRASMGIE